MQKTEKINFHIISHTHWDREWYLPFETFRLELIELMDNLLDILEQNKDFVFHLDGQTIVLKDYLEIRPHKKEQIKKFVKSGNLLIGPWYVLSDQFLTSAESTIRNLLYGIKDAKSFGNVMCIGYCPDQFGQIAQLPQILKSFNINSAIVGRGIQDSISEHTWYGLNGEDILAIALTHWYNNAQRLPEKENLHSYLDKIYTTQSSTSYSSHILLMNGCDHLFPQKNLSAILNGLNTNQKWEIKEKNLPDAIKKILESPNKNNFPIYYSELRDDNNKYILAGTLSSRVYLKLENYKNQTMLEKTIEPLSVFFSILKKSQYPFDELHYAWRLLIENHAHDSICGCSIDDVHKEMEIRFLKVNQVLEKLKENLLTDLHNYKEAANTAVSFGITSPREFSTTTPYNHYLQIINPTSYRRTDVIEAEIELPLGPPAEHPSATSTTTKKELENIVLKSEDKVLESKVLESKKTYKMVRSKDEVPLLQAIQRIKILFKADIKPYSITSYEIKENDNVTASEHKDINNNFNFENENYKLTLNKNGTFSILLKENGYNFENLHFLTLENDNGDEYNFVPDSTANTQFSSLFTWNIEVVEENSFRKIFFLSYKNKDTLDIESRIVCQKELDRIDIKTKINNRCKNKRIRLHFPTNLKTNYITADTAFGVIQRARPPVSWTNYATSQPLYNWISHTNGNCGLAFLGGGLADYELYENGNGFTVTLIRAVGRLSTVKSHSLIETPEAQCNREIEFSYALLPHRNTWDEADIHKEQLIYQSPIITNVSGLELNTKSLISVPESLLVSCLKRSENSANIYILRLFNPHNKVLKENEIKLDFPYKKVRLLNLNEDTILNEFIKEIKFEIKPYQILTFGIEI